MDSYTVAQMSGSELLSAYDTVHEQLTELTALGNEILTRLNGTDHAKQLGAHDTARLLAERYRLDPAEAARRVDFATALPKYPAVAAAFPTADSTVADGGVVLHAGQAQAIVFALEKIPKRADVPAEELAAAAERMVEAARHLAPGDLRSLGAQIRNILDTDGPEPREDAARAAEEVWIQKIDGGVKFGGRLAAENAELLQLTLQNGAKPHKTETGDPDPRSRGKRYADAMVDALRIAADCGDLPTRGGVKPHLMITIDLDTLIKAGRHATGDLTFGDNLSASAIRRLACDAGIIPIVLGSDSRTLDIGRERRLVTGTLRNALIQRDRGCVICHAPPIYCDAHHLTSWLDGGPTSLTNSVLLCRVHHTGLHQGHWTIEIINNQVHITRPTWAERPPHSQHRRLTPPSTPATAPTAASATPTCPPPKRRWPYADDATWITPEEAATLNPWPAIPAQPAPAQPTPTQPTPTHPSPPSPTPPAAGTTTPTTSATTDPDLPSTSTVSLFDPWADSA